MHISVSGCHFVGLTAVTSSAQMQLLWDDEESEKNYESLFRSV